MRRWMGLISLGLAFSVGTAGEEFQESETVVLKSRFFSKRMRAELGFGALAVMNQIYEYTYIAQAGIGFHFSEWFGVYGDGGYGGSFVKDNCRLLGSDFGIGPNYYDQVWNAGGGVTVTPAYSKYQLANGDVIYADFYLFGGGGMVNMRQGTGLCVTVPSSGAYANPSTVSNENVSQFHGGLGGRIFLGRNLGVDWKLKVVQIGAPAGQTALGWTTNVLLGLGVGYFL